jgi:hypothetical protein
MIFFALNTIPTCVVTDTQTYFYDPESREAMF